MREYFGLDAQRCWAMGYLLDLDCAEVDKEQIDVCVVDCLVLQARFHSICKPRSGSAGKTSCASATLHNSFHKIVQRQKRLESLCRRRASSHPPVLLDKRGPSQQGAEVRKQFVVALVWYD